MAGNLSKRLKDFIDALPLREELRILEIGCGSGAMARELSRRVTKGQVTAIDRSAKAIKLAVSGSAPEIETGRLSFRNVAIENFELESEEGPYDMAVAVRVGALDGRHPEIEKQALIKIAQALAPNGKLFIDGGDPLKEVLLDEYLPHLDKEIR
ncbi:class I SAM-dependent methyltransferase [Desertivirga brevis]|uniref:class I SAM-dependent methyltransferase n=1 Tax=Desertivirga brevis TaxID=2810310 RepID=UPI001A95E576|nr:class I SAM-dependent methyltransferase [Pedobacter sp. SYSU D00873]